MAFGVVGVSVRVRPAGEGRAVTTPGRRPASGEWSDCGSPRPPFALRQFFLPGTGGMNPGAWWQASLTFRPITGA